MSEDRFENRNEDNNRVNRQQSHKEERLNRTSHDPIRGLLPALILILLGVLFFSDHTRQSVLGYLVAIFPGGAGCYLPD